MAESIVMRTVSPLAKRLGRRFRTFVRTNPQVVAADLGIPDAVRMEGTSAGDSAAIRRARISRAQGTAQMLNRGAFDKTRRRENQDYRTMEREVPELANSNVVLVDFAFGGDAAQIDLETAGIEIIYSNARQEVIDTNADTARQLQFGQILPQILTEALRDGDSFTELIYRPGQLIAQKPLVPAEDAHVHWDEFARLAFYTFKNPGMEPQGFLPWQVAHLALDRKRGFRYGVSNWASARKIWRSEQAAMDVMGILTLMRAAARKSVTMAVPANTPAHEIWDHVNKMAQGGWSEELFDQDGFMHKRIAALLELDDIVYPYYAGSDPPSFHDEPAADLSQLREVLQYYQERYFVATGVPAGLAGLERNVNARSTLEHQGLFFVRKVKSLQRQIARLVMEILVKGLIAKGIMPRAGEFTVKMPTVSTFDEKVAATTNRIKAQTIKLLHVEGGMDLAWVLQFALHLDEDDAKAQAKAAGAEPGGEQPTEQEIAERLEKAGIPQAEKWLSAVAEDVLEVTSEEHAVELLREAREWFEQNATDEQIEDAPALLQP